MYCLDCGQKIEDGQTACPNCGLSVDDIKSRIAEAQEKLTYAETVGPAETTKLPSLAARVYRDKNGNIIDPAEEIDTSAKDEKNKAPLPVVGDSQDPLMTMPIKKIVSDEGAVIADQNNDVKSYIQPPKKAKGLSVRGKAVISLVVIFVIIAIVAAFMNSAGVFEHAEILDNDEVEAVEDNKEGEATDATEVTSSDEAIRQANIIKTLAKYYQDLGNYRVQVDAVVANFNNGYLANDKAKRQQYADECNALIGTITASKTQLIADMNSLGLPQEDPLFPTYESINHLYELLLTRLNVIKECWDLSLSYDVPSEHTQEILAPLSKDLKQGKSSSISDFDELYPQVVFPEV